jgi:hypothetical protein
MSNNYVYQIKLKKGWDYSLLSSADGQIIKNGKISLIKSFRVDNLYRVSIPETDAINGNPVVIGTTNFKKSDTRLLVANSDYANYWKISIPATHVRVDGIRNGWIISKNQEDKPIIFTSFSQSDLVAKLSVFALSTSFGVIVMMLQRKRKFKSKLEGTD